MEITGLDFPGRISREGCFSKAWFQAFSMYVLWLWVYVLMAYVYIVPFVHVRMWRCTHTHTKRFTYSCTHVTHLLQILRSHVYMCMHVHIPIWTCTSVHHLAVARTGSTHAHTCAHTQVCAHVSRESHAQVVHKHMHACACTYE